MRATDTQREGYTPKADADDPAYKRRVAEPVMQAVDSLPPSYRALVHEFGYVDVYRAWRRGWSVEQIRASASETGIFTLP